MSEVAESPVGVARARRGVRRWTPLSLAFTSALGVLLVLLAFVPVTMSENATRNAVKAERRSPAPRCAGLRAGVVIPRLRLTNTSSEAFIR